MYDFEYEIIKSNRRSISIQVKSDGRVIVRAPWFATNRQIDKFVNSKGEWVNKHLIKQRERSLAYKGVSDQELKKLYKKAKQVIPERVAYYAPLVGVDYGRITIRNQKTRWGSCSSKGNLNFNVRLMLTPIEVIDSVVVHELCHRIEMNHSERFYREVYRVYPDYDKWHRWLKKNGPTL